MSRSLPPADGAHERPDLGDERRREESARADALHGAPQVYGNPVTPDLTGRRTGGWSSPRSPTSGRVEQLFVLNVRTQAVHEENF